MACAEGVDGARHVSRARRRAPVPGRLGEVFEERRVEPLEVIDVDDERVISVVRVMGRSEKFGTEITADWAWLITLGRNRKGVRVETFTDKPQALEAAGLHPGPAAE
jgi:ketosteroid isomerase-like protein